MPSSASSIEQKSMRRPGRYWASSFHSATSRSCRELTKAPGVWIVDKGNAADQVTERGDWRPFEGDDVSRQSCSRSMRASGRPRRSLVQRIAFPGIDGDRKRERYRHAKSQRNLPRLGSEIDKLTQMSLAIACM